jgi:hypothetical protein
MFPGCWNTASPEHPTQRGLFRKMWFLPVIYLSKWSFNTPEGHSLVGVIKQSSKHLTLSRYKVRVTKPHNAHWTHLIWCFHIASHLGTLGKSSTPNTMVHFRHVQASGTFYPP